MTQYISKSAVVAEIERRISEVEQIDKASYEVGLLDAYKIILSFLNTIEVKEVDAIHPIDDVVSNDPIANTLEISRHGNSHNGDDLEEVATKYAQDKYLPVQTWQAFIAGAQWQKEQFEKNRLEQCDKITEEQYNLETGFIDQHIEKHHCMPTFLDAIEYGMKKQRENNYD